MGSRKRQPAPTYFVRILLPTTDGDYPADPAYQARLGKELDAELARNRLGDVASAGWGDTFKDITVEVTDVARAVPVLRDVLRNAHAPRRTTINEYQGDFDAGTRVCVRHGVWDEAVHTEPITRRGESAPAPPAPPAEASQPLRPGLEDPLLDRPRYEAALELVREIYDLCQSGQDFAAPLARLNKITVAPVGEEGIRDAAELIDEESFAYEITFDRTRVPTDLTYPEMLELVRRVRTNVGEGRQLAYWVGCLEANTGDRRMSTLLQAPERYAENGGALRDRPHAEILALALAAGGKAPSGQHP